MTKFERCLIWFGGYSPRTLIEAPSEDREAIAKIGGAVVFATIFAFINWGIAAWTYAHGSGFGVRLAITAIAASIGALIVAVMDRSFIYFADIAGEEERRKLFAYGAARVAIIIAVGFVTSQAVIPLLLESELKSHALQMAETAEKNRVADLNARYQVNQKEIDLAKQNKEIESLRLAATTLPPDIQRKISEAKECWAEHRTQKARLMTEGYSEAEARNKLSAKEFYCTERSSSANAERDSYFLRIRTLLDQKLKDKKAKEKELATVKSTIESKVEHAGLIEIESFNPRSSTVLWSLVKSNPGALAKWFLISCMLLVFELLPFLLKLQAGQSSIGRRIAYSRAIQKIELTKQLRQTEYDFDIFSAIGLISKNAANNALQQPEVMAFFEQVFAANISALAPLESVRSIMRNIEARHVDVNDFMHRYPNFASVIGQAWTKAIKDTSDMIAKKICPAN